MRSSFLSLAHAASALTFFLGFAGCSSASNGSVFQVTAAATHSSLSRSGPDQEARPDSASSVQPSRSISVATDLEAAVSCWAKWDQFSTSSTQCPKTTITGTPLTWTSNIVSTIRETFKLCDGHPRAIAAGGESTSTSLGEMSGTPYTTYTIVRPPSGMPVSTERTKVTITTEYPEISCASPVPTPQCSIGNNDCKALFSSWTAGSYSKLRPPCTYDLPKDPCDNCWIYVPSVQLIYFPVSMTGDFCGDSYLTATPASQPNVSTPTTVQVSGATFTSGYVYLSYAGVTATGNSGICGTTKPAGILSIPSTQLSSYRGHAAAMEIAGDTQYPFNFADLAPNPVPWDAWISQETCYTHQDYPTCQTITQAAYRPWIVYPSEFWSLNTQWSNCVSGIFGIMDPPTALSVKQEALPTMPSDRHDPTTTAQPKMEPSHTITKATATLENHHHTVSVRPHQTKSPRPELIHSFYPGTHRSTSINDPTPSVQITLAGDAYTIYTDGMIAGDGTIVNLSPHSTTSIAGHIVSISDGKIWIDSSSVAFHDPQTADSQMSSARNAAQTIILETFAHRSTQMTLSGQINSAGDTVVTLGTNIITNLGQTLTLNGTTYGAVGTYSDPKTKTGLPKIVSAESSTDLVPPLLTPSSISNTQSSGSASGTVSSSDASIKLPYLYLPVTLLGTIITMYYWNA